MHVEWITLHHRLQREKQGHFSTHCITPGQAQHLLCLVWCRQHSARHESTGGQGGCHSNTRNSRRETVLQKGQPQQSPGAGRYPRPGSQGMRQLAEVFTNNHFPDLFKASIIAPLPKKPAASCVYALVTLLLHTTLIVICVITAELTCFSRPTHFIVMLTLC